MSGSPDAPDAATQISGLIFAVMLVDDQDRILQVNPAAEELLGRSARRLLDIGRRVRFVTQAAQEGFGHAVYCAREALGEEPFLLMLGDHLYRADDGGSCARQVVEALFTALSLKKASVRRRRRWRWRRRRWRWRWRWLT